MQGNGENIAIERTLSNAEAAALANVLKRSLPQTFREVFAPDFLPEPPSEEDDIQGLGKMIATRVVEPDGGKTLSLIVKPAASLEILNDAVYSLQQAVFRIHKSEDIPPLVAFNGIRWDGEIVESTPTTESAAAEIRAFAKRLKPFKGRV